MGYADFLKNLIPPSYNPGGEVFQVFLGAVGVALDQYAPSQITLKNEFSATKATGAALDTQGADWGVARRSGESDASYRSRILSILPLYVNGPTVDGISAVVKPFTGTAPVIFEYGPAAFIMGESTIGDAGFSTAADLFTFEIQVQNPLALAYNHIDMENAVRNTKMARSTAIIYHNGTDTSVAVETSTAIITII
ncbi:MAG: hypothetical protein ACYCVD_04260 [Desulfitobacteriaceae bacterium]